VRRGRTFSTTTDETVTRDTAIESRSGLHAFAVS